MHHMNLNQIDMNLLVALEALLQEQSVTKAAGRVGRSQPAMSRALNRLRDTFDDPLFVPAGRGLMPTPRALALREPLSAVLEELRGLLDPPEFDPTTSTTSFHIGAPDSVVMLVLSEFLAEVESLAPAMDITISSAAGGHLEALDAGEIDLALDTFIDAPDRFHRQGLMASNLVTVLRRDHPARRNSYDVEAFVHWPHIWVDTALNRALDVRLERQGIHRRCPVRVNSFFTGAILALKSDYVMVLPELIAFRARDYMPLAVLPVPVDLPRLGLDQIWHPRRQHDPSHIWLRNTIAAVAQMQKPSGGAAD